MSDHLSSDQLGMRAVKQQARNQARAARKAISTTDRIELSLKICEHIRKSQAWIESRTVLTYFAAGSEVDLNDLWQSRMGAAFGPVTLGAPVVEGENIRFGHVRTGKEGSPLTILGPYGLREPDGPPVDLNEVGLILVPLLAYDSAGNRLGSGKGFYDRFLAANPEMAQRAMIMGVAFSAQRVGALTTEPHDYQLDAVVTEHGITNWREA